MHAPPPPVEAPPPLPEGFTLGRPPVAGTFEILMRQSKFRKSTWEDLEDPAKSGTHWVFEGQWSWDPVKQVLAKINSTEQCCPFGHFMAWRPAR